MKKKLTKIFLSTAMILLVVGVAVIPQQTEASCVSLITFNLGECVTDTATWVGNIFLGVSAYLITVTGALLSFSIKITLNIKDLYDHTDAIKNTWRVIRDISSIFIIFILLYASISTIVGIGRTNIKDIIGKVIIVGLLINFSLFFTKVAIDASNLISLQFYRAIAPQYADSGASGSAYLDGGLSNVFMNSLKIQSIYHPTNADIFKGGKGEGSIFFSIIIATIGGSILMIMASLSFLAAAVAFSIRTGILLLLMVFSPIYFVGMILPRLKSEVSDKWIKKLTDQLVFMPVYLLLMYVALRIISDGSFLSFIQTKDPANSNFIMTQVGIIIQYFIAILFINAPLIAALSMGGKGIGWAKSASEGLNKGIASAIGRNTAGKAGKYFGRTFDSVANTMNNSKFGKVSSSILKYSTLGASGAATKAVRRGLTNMEKGKYGSQSLEDVKKEDKERDKQLKGVARLKELDDAIKIKNPTTGLPDAKKIKDVLNKMSTSEIAALKTSYLKNKHVTPHLSSAVHTAIDKGDKSDQDKVEIEEARHKELTDAVTSSNLDNVKNIMKNMSGSDLQKYIEETHPPGAGIPMGLIAQMRGSQLKDMDGMDPVLRKEIGNAITTMFPSTHQSETFINKNESAWL